METAKKLAMKEALVEGNMLNCVLKYANPSKPSKYTNILQYLAVQDQGGSIW